MFDVIYPPHSEIKQASFVQVANCDIAANDWAKLANLKLPSITTLNSNVSLLSISYSLPAIPIMESIEFAEDITS